MLFINGRLSKNCYRRLFDIKILIFLANCVILSLQAMEMMVFNVGQGNCTVVRHPNDAHLLIDAGSAKVPYYRTAKKIVAEITDYILQGKPSKLVIIVSHGHKDHYGWIPQIADLLVKNNISINLFLGGTAEDYKAGTCKELLRVKNQVRGTFVDDFPDNRLHHFDKLLPSYCTVKAACIDGSKCDPNCRSIVLFIHDLETVVPGDATGATTKAIELAQLPLKARFLIVPHHGSNSEGSNSETFLRAVAPEFALISCSDRYNHPEAPVISRLMSHLKNLPATSPHLLTYYSPQGEVVDTQGRAPVVFSYQHGYRTVITNYPIYTTADMREMKIVKLQDSTLVLSFPNDPIRALKVSECIIKAIQNPPLENLSCIAIPDTCLTDADVLSLTALPLTLSKLILDKNMIAPGAILHILRLLTNHAQPIVIGIRELGMLVGHFEWMVRNDLPIAQLLRKWLFFCVMKGDGHQKNQRQFLEEEVLESIHFTRGSTGPTPLLYVPAYVFPYFQQGKDSYVLNRYYENQSYLKDLAKLEANSK